MSCSQTIRTHEKGVWGAVSASLQDTGEKLTQMRWAAGAGKVGGAGRALSAGRAERRAE